APPRFEVSYANGKLGDWRSELHLPHHSGAVEYVKSFSVGEPSEVVFDLGHIRGTAEVWIDGENVGSRAWRPYYFLSGKTLSRGDHELRIRVTNTLGAHYEVGRPSYVVGGEPLYWNEDDESGS